MRYWMMNNVEEQLREKYCQYRSKHGKKNIFKEVPVFSRSVDLVEYDDHSRKITAIEFKINDWKRAINQLISVSPCFDYLVLCLPKPKTEKCLDNIKIKCIEKGIGLITWESDSDTFTHECEARSVDSIWNAQKRCVINYIKGQRGGNNNE